MSQNTRTYPRQAWVLTPSFKPKEVTIEALCGYFGCDDNWDYAEGGKAYHFTELYTTKAAAIASGRARIVTLQADINKRQDTLNKRVAALDKAEAE